MEVSTRAETYTIDGIFVHFVHFFPVNPPVAISSSVIGHPEQIGSPCNMHFMHLPGEAVDLITVFDCCEFEHKYTPF